ncbi:MAG: hypothetical protein RLZZ563_1670 [Pseudomonadota bacterium]|jgi:hypothetical protein
MKNLLVITAFAMLATTAAQAQTAPADCVNILGFCIPAHQEQATQTRRGEDDKMMTPMMMEKDMDMPGTEGPAMQAPAAPGMMGMMN